MRVDDAQQVADVYHAQRAANLPQGLLVTVPVPQSAAIATEIVEPLIDRAVREAEDQGVSGKALTPFILERMVILSDSRTRVANENLLIHNAGVASLIARAVV